MIICSTEKLKVGQIINDKSESDFGLYLNQGLRTEIQPILVLREASMTEYFNEHPLAIISTQRLKFIYKEIYFYEVHTD